MFMGTNFNGDKRRRLEWPPKSPDYAPLDFVLWGNLKNQTAPLNIGLSQKLLGMYLSDCSALSLAEK